MDTFPGRGDFDQDAGFVDPGGFVKLCSRALAAPHNFHHTSPIAAYLDDMQSFLDRHFCVKRESRIHLRRDLSRYYLQNLLAKLNQEPIQCRIDLFVLIIALERK